MKVAVQKVSTYFTHLLCAVFPIIKASLVLATFLNKFALALLMKSMKKKPLMREGIGNYPTLTATWMFKNPERVLPGDRENEQTSKKFFQLLINWIVGT